MLCFYHTATAVELGQRRRVQHVRHISPWDLRYAPNDIPSRSGLIRGARVPNAVRRPGRVGRWPGLGHPPPPPKIRKSRRRRFFVRCTPRGWDAAKPKNKITARGRARTPVGLPAKVGARARVPGKPRGHRSVSFGSAAALLRERPKTGDRERRKRKIRSSCFLVPYLPCAQAVSARSATLLVLWVGRVGWSSLAPLVPCRPARRRVPCWGL